MIKLEKVTLHNFLPFNGTMTLQLDNQGLTLVEGRNNSSDSYSSSGSGKSSLLSGVTYAIYGRTVNGITSDKVINKQAGTDCYVMLYFTIGDNHYRIERYRKGKHGNHNKLKLFMNDKEITESSIARTEAKIGELINIDFTTYINTISYGSSDEPTFAKATDKGKKEIIENLANVAIYEKARKLSSDKQREQSNLISSIESQRAIYSSSLDNYTKLAKDEQERYKEQLEQVQKVKDTYELHRKTYKINHTKNEEVKKAINEKLSALVKPETVDSSELNEAYAYHTKLTQAQSQLSYQKSNYESQIKDLTNQYKETAGKTVCPVCGQKLDETHRKKEMVAILLKLKEASDASQKVAERLTNSDKVISEQKAKLSKLQSVNSKYTQALNEYTQQYNDLHDKLRQLDYNDSSQLAMLKQEQAKIDAKVSQPITYDEQIKEAKAKIAELDKKKQEAEKLSEQYKTLAAKVFSRQGITSAVLDLITPYLNEHTNYYLSILSGSVLRVDMSTQTVNADKSLSDKFNLSVYNSAGADSYMNCSDGERKRIDIAISFAIQDLQQSHQDMTTNMLIYDECFDGLDAIGCESVIDILKQKAKDLDSIFVITHNDTLKPLFDNVITVVKNAEGISKVKVDS